MHPSENTAVDDKPAQGGWLWERIASIPQEAKDRFMQQTGLSKPRTSLAQPHRVEDEEWGFARLPSLDEMLDAVQQGKESPFLSRLQSSRTFNSPDCAGSMAEVYRIGRLLEGLKGCACARDGASEEAVENLRVSLKLGIKAAWSKEAVRRGVASAKNGDYENAHKCYARALELDRRNEDAWVARGAAHANERKFQQAAQDFQTALEINPDDCNAAKYLEATKQRMAQLGMQMLSPSAQELQRGAVAMGRQRSVGESHTPGSEDKGMGDAVKAAGEPERHQSGAPAEKGNAQASSSQDQSSDSEDQEEMDLQQALKIVAEHYSRRNAQLSGVHNTNAECHLLVWIYGPPHDGSVALERFSKVYLAILHVHVPGFVRRDKKRDKKNGHSKRKRHKQDDKDDPLHLTQSKKRKKKRRKSKGKDLDDLEDSKKVERTHA